MGKDRINADIAITENRGIKSPMEVSDQKMSNLPHQPKYNSSQYEISPSNGKVS